MVIDILEARLVMLFVEGLSEPLRGWVKGFEPTTLCVAINKTKDKQDASSKNKFTLKPSFPQKSKEVKPFQKEWIRKPKVDEETWKELWKKKLCLTCQEPWAPRHKCAGKDMVGKAHYIEVYSDSGSDDGDE